MLSVACLAAGSIVLCGVNLLDNAERTSGDFECTTFSLRVPLD